MVTSNIKVEYPINLLPALSAFVAPILPEPISLISFLINILALFLGPMRKKKVLIFT